MKASMIITSLAFAMLTAEPVFAASTSNVYLTGKVFRGEEVVTTFDAPILLGSTLPVKDQVTEGSGIVKTVQIALTPEETAGSSVTVSITANWSESGGPTKGAVVGGTMTDKVTLAQGESRAIPFGSCVPVVGKPDECSLRLVLSASAQR